MIDVTELGIVIEVILLLENNSVPISVILLSITILVLAFWKVEEAKLLMLDLKIKLPTILLSNICNALLSNEVTVLGIVIDSLFFR